MNGLQQAINKLVERVAIRIKELLEDHIRSDIYDTYVPNLYERTHELENSVVAISNGIAEYLIFSDDSLLNTKRQRSGFTQHFDKPLLEKLNEWAKGTGEQYPWNEAHEPAFDNTIKALKSGEFAKIVKSEAAAIGLTLI